MAGLGAVMSLVGTKSEPFRFVVEEAQVRAFSAAVFDSHGDDAIAPVPPTFPMLGVADFERGFLFDVLRLDRTRTLNAGQEYDYARPLKVGDRLLCVGTVTQDYEKQGRRGGRLRFVVVEVEMRDEQTGELVVTSRATAVETGEGSDR
jgi:hypothetical protein